jgi:hypothetical protein
MYSGTDTCVQVTDLLPGTTYEFRLQAHNSHGASEWSDIGAATTLPSAPMPPEAPAVTSVAAHSVHVSWSEPYGQGSPVTGYSVNVARLGPSSSGSSRIAAAVVNGGSLRSATTSESGSVGEAWLQGFQRRKCIAAALYKCRHTLSLFTQFIIVVAELGGATAA